MLKVVLVLTPLVTIGVLLQKRILNAVILLGVYSLLSSGAYFLLGAPNVAVTEAAIGVAFLTFIYVIALSSQGKIQVLVEEVPRFMFQEGAQLQGIDYEILDGFAREMNLDLEVMFAPREDFLSRVTGRGNYLIAGAFLPSEEEREDLLVTRPYTSVRLVEVSKEKRQVESRLDEKENRMGQVVSTLPHAGREEIISDFENGVIGSFLIDYPRIGGLLDTEAEESDRHYQLEEKGQANYVFATSGKNEDLFQELQSYLRRIERDGTLEEIRSKYLG